MDPSKYTPRVEASASPVNVNGSGKQSTLPVVQRTGSYSMALAECLLLILLCLTGISSLASKL